MAKRETIARLFAASKGERTDLRSIGLKAQSSAIAEHLPPVRERAVRGRFVLTEPAPVTSYALPQAELLTFMAPNAPLDRSGEWAQIAAREQFERLAQRYLSGRGRDPSRSSRTMIHA